MKNRLMIPVLILLTALASSCQVIGGIFKAGVWTGVIIIVVLIGLVIYLVTRIRR